MRTGVGAYKGNYDVSKKQITKRDAQRLQSLIHRKAYHQEKDYFLGVEINNLTEKYFGHAASDIDCDWIIDALFGGAGGGSSMSLSEYVRWMNEDGSTEVTISDAYSPNTPRLNRKGP